MDLKKILGHLEDHENLIRQIESEVGRDFVPRSEFNTKNNEVKEKERLLGELRVSIDESSKKSEEHEKTIADLSGKLTSFELRQLKMRVANEKGIPFELSERLNGKDEKEIREDAEMLSKLVSSNTKVTAPLKSTEPAAGSSEKQEFKSLLSGLRGE